MGYRIHKIAGGKNVQEYLQNRSPFEKGAWNYKKMI